MHMAPLAGSDLELRIARGEVIPQMESCPDKQYPEITWNQYGIVPTNEVAVVGSCGSAQYFARAPSYLVVPVMADRIFGTDVVDERLGHELAGVLWERHGAELTAEVLRLRGPVGL